MRQFNRLLLLLAITCNPVFAQSNSWNDAITAAAQAFRHQRYDEAETCFLKAQTEAESLGPDNPRVGTTINNLAELYVREAKYAKAEPLFKRALRIWEKADDSTAAALSKATVLNNLAALYEYQSRYIESEPLYLKCLALREKILGPEHPDVASTLNNLGALYWEMGKI